MAKKKQHQDELETLKQENKKLEQTNRVLRKRLKRLEQFAEQVEEHEEEAKEELLTDEYIPPSEDNKCPDCGDYAVLVKVAGRSFRKCSRYGMGCSWRTPSKSD